MFPTRYFPNRYFAPRYFPKVGAEPELDTVDVYFELRRGPQYVKVKSNDEARPELLSNDEARPILRGAP